MAAATRKVPLGNNPNAANSPYHGPAASKRARAYTNDVENENSPPKKKQILDASFNVTKPSAARSFPDESTVLDKPVGRATSSFQKRLLAERDIRPTTQASKPSEVLSRPANGHVATDRDNLQSLQNWKRHYRRAFPNFVLYFDSLPPDTALRFSRQANTLRAKVESFFSKDVTHVITTRSLPQAGADLRTTQTDSQRPETINPAMLNKPDAMTRTRNGADLLQRRAQPSGNDARQSTGNDVLSKAREMGIKIWPVDKFERIMATLFSHEGSEDDDSQAKRPAVSSLVPVKRDREADLSQLLRNERKNAPVDRKPWQDILPFRAIYIYVHDMDERTKPVMVREYPKPVHKEDGKWPMFRSVSNGRCPFVEEVQPPSREQLEARRARVAPPVVRPIRPTRAAVQEKKAVLETNLELPRTRAVTQSPQKERPALREAPTVANQMPKPQMPASKAIPGEMPRLQRQMSGSTGDMPPLLGSTHANYHGLPRKPGGEPLASGMQANITSAIRSQMYSSTAPSAPGQRVGTTKQQHQMSRRILEKQSGLSNSTLPSSVNITEIRAALNKDQPVGSRRTTRLRATKKLAKIHEDETLSEEEDVDELDEPRPMPVTRRKAPVQRDPKPGYCENCRDKYDDFHEHIVSKTHRKFALAPENFADLDKLLKVLTRR